MDEVITCPKCCNQTWVIGTSGTRCGKCAYWLEPGQVVAAVAEINKRLKAANEKTGNHGTDDIGKDEPKKL